MGLGLDGPGWGMIHVMWLVSDHGHERIVCSGDDEDVLANFMLRLMSGVDLWMLLFRIYLLLG